MATPKASIVILGSLNVDIIATVQRLPGEGETIAASSLIRRCGGKGANQALAAQRQGVAVTMIGCLGEDADGAAYRTRFEKAGIHMGQVRSVAKQPTGTALIAVDAQGENLIVVASGANAAVSAAMVKRARPEIGRASALLTQLEVPMNAVVTAMHIANRSGVPVVFNPSPFRTDFPWGSVMINVLIVNETEAAELFRQPVQALVRSAKRWGAALRRRRIETLIITRGSRSTLLLTQAGLVEIPTLPVVPVDTVGAGDAFAGSLTAHLAGGASLERAIAYANAAGALATQKAGAQEAIPSRSQVERALREFATRASTL